MDELELRSRLAESAALAGPLGFTAEEVAARGRRIRRRRRSRIGVIAGVSVAAVVSAVVIPLSRSGTSELILGPPALAPGLSYTVTVNGQTRAVPAMGGAPGLFTVTPGQKLTMTVKVKVPGPQAMTALWLGITNGVLSTHANMKPLLAASTRVRLRPGAYRFVLHWAVPAGLRPGITRQLSVEWTWSGKEPGGAEREVAEFAVPLQPGAESPAAVALRLHAVALRSVVICDGVSPAWIHAVRTTFGKAIAAVGGGNDLGENGAAVVYLVLMKGDFQFSRLDCKHMAGGYFSAIVDAATFMTLESGVGNHPLLYPLRTLGPVLNLAHTTP